MPFGQSEDLLLQIKLTALSLVFTGISELWWTSGFLSCYWSKLHS
jgi:hypothetical protein